MNVWYACGGGDENPVWAELVTAAMLLAGRRLCSASWE
jgi:hypothetical protein